MIYLWCFYNFILNRLFFVSPNGSQHHNVNTGRVEWLHVNVNSSFGHFNHTKLNETVTSLVMVFPNLISGISGNGCCRYMGCPARGWVRRWGAVSGWERAAALLKRMSKSSAQIKWVIFESKSPLLRVEVNATISTNYHMSDPDYESPYIKAMLPRQPCWINKALSSIKYT